jgi:hypothetical protein
VLASPAAVIAQLRAAEPVDSLAGVDLVDVLGRATYRVHYFTSEGDKTVRRTRLADAASGTLREPIAREEAIAAARAAMRDDLRLVGAELVTDATVDGHHEYRGGSLPAWAVSFDGPERATAYVPVDLGRVDRVRNDRWRAFDLLWMLHTMDRHSASRRFSPASPSSHSRRDRSVASAPGGATWPCPPDGGPYDASACAPRTPRARRW